MLTYEQAADLVLTRLIKIWDVDATPYVSPNGFEDDRYFMVPWNTREFMVDGDMSKMLINNVVTFVDKETGVIDMLPMTENFDRVDAMREINLSN
jgi:hypothetical protein